MTAPFRSGFVALLGKPNAGKSTLLNRVVGAKLAAVSALPQTTRERLHGILTDKRRQIVFVDLPGLLDASDTLNSALRQNVLDGLEGVDVVLHLVDSADKNPFPPDVVETVQAIRTPLVLAITKLDGRHERLDAASHAGEILPEGLRTKYHAIAGVSAKSGAGIDALLETLDAFLPEGEPLFDPDDLTDRDLRYLAQEAIREKAFLLLHEELPYATAVLVDEFKEREARKWYIRATIYVERDSQKGMVIGRGGAMLKKISTAARADLERLCEAPVYLDLWVKVREKWRRNEADLRFFGIRDPRRRKRP